jgi:hypothetical protein
MQIFTESEDGGILITLPIIHRCSVGKGPCRFRAQRICTITRYQISLIN